jgi:phospholipase C
LDVRNAPARGLDGVCVGLLACIFAQFSSGAASAKSTLIPARHTRTPIKHLIVIIGENRSFDHVFATYAPKSGETVNNLLSEGIIALDSNKKAIPGPNFQKARQYAASDTDTFLLSPPKVEFPTN